MRHKFTVITLKFEPKEVIVSLSKSKHCYKLYIYKFKFSLIIKKYIIFIDVKIKNYNILFAKLFLKILICGLMLSITIEILHISSSKFYNIRK